MAATRPTETSATRAAAAGRHALLELVCLVGLVEMIMWAVPFVPGQRAAYAGLAAMILVLLATCHARDRLGARAAGLRLDNFFEVLARQAVPLGAFVLLVLAVGYLTGSLRFGRKFYSMLASVPAWALLQQYMLLAFANRRLRLIAGQARASVALTAALFSLLHLPNPVLTLACALGGYVWAREYERSPNLLANAVAHTLASAVIANSLPGWLLKNMVVGYNYFLR